MPTNLREALDQLREIVSKKDIVPILTHYVCKDGRLYASDGNLVASSPVDSKENFAVRAPEFYRFLDKTAGDIKLQVLENFHVKVSCGRYRATIPGLEVNCPGRQPEGKSYKVDHNKFIQALKAVRPFISDNATQMWALNAQVANGCIEASNNITLVRAEDSGLARDFRMLLPYDAADHVLFKRARLTGIVQCDNATWFRWEDDSWLQVPMMAYKFPNTDPIWTSMPEAELPVDEEWRKAAQHVLDLTGGASARIDNKQIVSMTDSGAEISADAECAIAGDITGSWNGKYLGPVLESATHFNMFMFGKGPRLAFRCKSMKGILMGMV